MYFKKFGNVENVRVFAKQTHTFAFVTFAKAEDAAKTLSQGEHYIGRKVRVSAGDSWHQTDKPVPPHERADVHGEPSGVVNLAIELTNLTGTHLLDLNDDCLYELLTYVAKRSVIDLSQAAETCGRLKSIATNVFASLNKKTPGGLLGELANGSLPHMRLVLRNFGPFIEDIRLRKDAGKANGMAMEQINLLRLHCNASLKTLALENFMITKNIAVVLKTVFGNLKKLVFDQSKFTAGAKSTNLFENCQSLVTLKYATSDELNRNTFEHVFQHTFANLESLSLKEGMEAIDIDTDLAPFLRHHPNLKKLSLKSFEADYYTIFPTIADNLLQLEKLYIQANAHGDDEEFIEHLNKLSTLEHLKKLKLSCEKKPINTFLRDLKSVESLEHLRLSRTKADAEFFVNLSKFKNIRILHLTDVDHQSSITPLGELKEITELLLKGRLQLSNEELIALLKKLAKLKKLTFIATGFELDDSTYRKLVDVIGKRDDCLPLELVNYEDMQDEVMLAENEDYNKYVKFQWHGSYEHSLMNDDYSDDDDPFSSDDPFDSDDSHYGYDYGFSDSDDDMFGIPNGYDLAFMNFLLDHNNPFV